jgi:hypothetical protein
MLTEFLLSLIPATGGIAYGIGNKLGHVRGYERAVATARREAQQELKIKIGMLEYEDHLNGAKGHICGETCFNMMKLQSKMREMTQYD